MRRKFYRKTYSSYAVRLRRRKKIKFSQLVFFVSFLKISLRLRPSAAKRNRTAKGQTAKTGVSGKPVCL